MSVRNALNTLLMFGVLVPPAVFTWHLKTTCSAAQNPGATTLDILMDSLQPARLKQLLETPTAACELYQHHPAVYVNVVFFVVRVPPH